MSKMSWKTNVYLMFFAVLCITARIHGQNENQSELSQKTQEKYCPARNE